jgi:IclR family mhp operon transcriptional activator
MAQGQTDIESAGGGAMSYKPVEATLRSFQVLEAVSRLGAARPRDIEQETGLSGPTVIRILGTLIVAGYVYQHEPRGRYAVTARVVALAAGHRASAELAAHAAPVLLDLQRTLGWPSDLAIREGDEMVNLPTPATGRLSYNPPAGFRSRLLGTSLGLALLAHLPEAEIAAVVGRLPRSLDIEHDAPWTPADLLRKLDAVRRHGYSARPSGAPASMLPTNLQALAVPVLVSGYAVAALNVIFLRSAVSRARTIRQVVPRLQQAAAEIGAAYGASLR